ncbi:MAG: Uma2 family endonuclease [Candidatus Melainabacteria bacterium]|nr:Uma2 family endonuclease [Candidatus Melainabacteria bacterium]
MQKPSKHVSAEEFLAFESSSTSKHEYVNGEVFAMAGGTQAHSLISTNITFILKSKLDGSGCRVHGSELLLRVDASNSFYYPDAMVDCGDYDKDRTFTSSPAIIFEVLSRSTVSIDRREKLVAYKRIPSLKAYVIVQQARQHLEIHRKDANGNWSIEEAESTGRFELEVCPGTAIVIEVEKIYESANVSDGPDLHLREDAEMYAW